MIYARVPNRRVPWRAVWPGALGATIAIGVIDFAFPAYLSNISTLARFGTTIVFVLIMLGWFYVLAMIILGGAIVNALRLKGHRARHEDRGVSVPSRWPPTPTPSYTAGA